MDKHIKTDSDYMNEALLEARIAYDLGEVPIGAVVVDNNGLIIGRGYNQRETKADVTGHAEILAIHDAAKNVGTWRLDECTVYVTLEPCFMCASALQQARIKSVCFGAKDPKAGAVTSLAQFYEQYPQNHTVEWHAGIEEEACSQILKTFFRELRKRNAEQNKSLGGRGKRKQAAKDQTLGKPGDPCC